MAASLSKGSVWRRWDPHIHTPSTLMANQFRGDWDGYLDAIEKATPTVEALGLTEYCVLRGYKEFKAKQREGRAANVHFVFPNVEFRLEVQTEKKRGVNLHLLFSPYDTDHVERIEGSLRSLKFTFNKEVYGCDEADLIRLGRLADPHQSDDLGALKKGVEQFKLNTDDLVQLFHDSEWMQNNCLVAIDAGEADGTSGLKNDDSFKLKRQELEALADIIFCPSESVRSYWLGEKDEEHNRYYIEKKYRCLKPCLHGSDAHALDRVLKPAMDRYCWLRTDLTFEGLKQTLLEPSTRVSIGPEPPQGPRESECIASIYVEAAPWLKTNEMELNDGLVAIIGPKGSGKTALANIIAHAAGVSIDDEKSFLTKAFDELDDEKAMLTWADGLTDDAKRLKDSIPDFEVGRVRYLSQQFVDRLCSETGVGSELLSEIENVVFQAIPEEDRRGATTFAELRGDQVESIKALRADELERIQQLTATIAAEDTQKANLPILKKKLEEGAAAIKKAEDDLKKLMPKAKEKEVAELGAVSAAAEPKEREFEGLKTKQAKLEELEARFPRVVLAWRRSYEDLKQTYQTLSFSDEEWKAFEPRTDDVAPALAAKKKMLEDQVYTLVIGSPSKPRIDSVHATWSLTDLRAKTKELNAAIGVEKERGQKYKLLSDQINAQKRSLTRLEAEIKHAEAWGDRRKKAIEERQAAYVATFDFLKQEQEVLEKLYLPLKQQIARSNTKQQQGLEFYVQRQVDLDGWVARGEGLLDLRKSGAFQGRGTLANAAKEQLLPAWRGGKPEEAGVAIEAFLTQHRTELSQCRRDGVRLQEIGAWLFATDHIELVYGIKYDGVELSKLSPGMRGTVLLMLYLTVDHWDTRPLIVDQPEENLDPQSVYQELVGYFRAAKQRRQVILVTHNPNLVVNADADQVIVADSKREGTGLPLISYLSGALDDKTIRAAVCRVLEGGERAFRDRERRYDLPRDLRSSR